MREQKTSAMPQEEKTQTIEKGESVIDGHGQSGQTEETGNFEEEAGLPAVSGNDKISDESETENRVPGDAPESGQLLEAIHNISEQLSALTEVFNKKILYSAQEEKIINRMHEELQKYKQDMYTQLVRPVLLDIIEVRDSILHIGEIYRMKPEGEQDIPNKMFSDYAYHDLQQILGKNNVEIYRSETGDKFVPLKQRIVKKVPASDQTLHGRIAESMSCGYDYNGRTISAEKVSVYYHEELSEKDKSEVKNNG